MTPLTLIGIAALLAGQAQAHADARVNREDPRIERWYVETGLGFGSHQDSPYTARLEDFGFERPWHLFGPEVVEIEASVVHTPVPNLGLVLSAGNMDADSWSRDMTREDAPMDFQESYRWTTWRGGVYARASVPMVQGWLTPYLQAGGGPALALATYSDPDVDDRRAQLGWHATAAAGLQMMLAIPGHRHFGVYGQVQTSYAPVLENLTGEVHDSGGVSLMSGIRLGY